MPTVSVDCSEDMGNFYDLDSTNNSIESKSVLVMSDGNTGDAGRVCNKTPSAS